MLSIFSSRPLPCLRNIILPRLPPLRRSSSAVTTTEDTPKKTEEEKVETVRPIVAELKKTYASNPPALMEFFDDYENWGVDKVRSGREWRVEELRIKSNEDLHKLWYVLVKERNMLMTMKYEANEQKELFPNPERLDRVEQSMINIEKVVRERNKAYFELEVGEGETAERPACFRRDLFGRHRTVACSQHLIPYWMNTKWRNLYGPGHGRYVWEFMALYREKKARKAKAQTLLEWQIVRQLVRRFPDIDLDYLQEKYPRVPVRFMKENEAFYEENRLIDDTIFDK